MRDLPPITWANIGLGVTALLIGWLVSKGVRWAVTRSVAWRGRSSSSATLFGRLASWCVLVVAVAAALTIAFPSVRPVDVLGGVGVVSIAAGIAFQTVLGNMFAGIVLVSRDIFRVGDQIAVGEHRGTITAIDLTATTIRTFDGRLVVIPNGVLHSEVVTVQTGYEQVRTTVSLDLDDRADLERARTVAVAAMSSLPAVLAQPAPDALYSAVGTRTVRMDLRFWSASLQLETRTAQHQVIGAVLSAFEREGIPTGSDTISVELADGSAQEPTG